MLDSNRKLVELFGRGLLGQSVGALLGILQNSGDRQQAFKECRNASANFLSLVDCTRASTSG